MIFPTFLFKFYDFYDFFYWENLIFKIIKLTLTTNVALFCTKYCTIQIKTLFLHHVIRLIKINIMKAKQFFNGISDLYKVILKKNKFIIYVDDENCFFPIFHGEITKNNVLFIHGEKNDFYLKLIESKCDVDGIIFIDCTNNSNKIDVLPT